MIQLLQKNWHSELKKVFSESNEEIFISSPYITEEGINFFVKNVSQKIKESGRLNVLSNLSPINIIQGSTSPKALQLLDSNFKNFTLRHLPSLHAKVYVSDKKKAIVTSGNLTAGGLFNNYEYGIFVEDESYSKLIHDDLLSFSLLGSEINTETLNSYVLISEELKETYRSQQNIVKNSITKKFKVLAVEAENILIQEKLNQAPIHRVFSQTILYILSKYGDLPTTEIHHHINQIHPDLCDNNVDRVINGKHFGKKWKHYVRTSQQHLKRRNQIEFENGLWKKL